MQLANAPAPLETLAAHAFLAPSAGGRWVLCPGSALMEALHPEGGDKEAAAEGITAHWVMQMRFAGHIVPVGARDPAGIFITQEMIEAAELIYVDVVTTLGPNWAQMVRIERRVNIPRVHPKCWGTPDVLAWALVNGRYVLYVWDLKYGHKHVEVFECWQLILYASGGISEVNDYPHASMQTSLPETHIDVVLRIVQPRSYHVDGPIREWKTTATALRAFEFRLQMAAEEATAPDPTCKPHPDACENCSAKGPFCEASMKAAYHAVDLAGRAHSMRMTPFELGLTARSMDHALGILEACVTGLKQQIESTIAAGTQVPFWAMEQSGGRTRWEVPAPVVIETARLLGIDVAKPAEAITPKQAEARGMDAGVVKVMSFTPPGARKLKEDTGATARKIFGSGA